MFSTGSGYTPYVIHTITPNLGGKLWKQGGGSTNCMFQILLIHHLVSQGILCEVQVDFVQNFPAAPLGVMCEAWVTFSKYSTLRCEISE